MASDKLDEAALAECRKAFEERTASRGISIEMEPDAWGRPRYKHSHVDSMWDGFQAAWSARDSKPVESDTFNATCETAPEVKETAREYLERTCFAAPSTPSMQPPPREAAREMRRGRGMDKERILIDLALKFTKDCLGLESFSSNGSVEDEAIITIQKCGDGKNRPFSFYYNNIADVLESVRNWCQKNSFGWHIGSADETDRLTAVIYIDMDEVERPWISEHGDLDENPCYTLMSACVEAAKVISEAKP